MNLKELGEFVTSFVTSDKSKYFISPSGKRYYAKIGSKNWEKDVVDRIFEEEGFQPILKEIEITKGRNIEKWRFLMYAGYMIVNEGKKNELKTLTYCSDESSKKNDFVKQKKHEWKNDKTASFVNLYVPDFPEEAKKMLRDTIELVISKIEEAKTVDKKSIDEQR